MKYEKIKHICDVIVDDYLIMLVVLLVYVVTLVLVVCAEILCVLFYISI